VPIAEALRLPMIKSGYQSPGTARFFTSAGRWEMLIMFGIAVFPLSRLAAAFYPVPQPLVDGQFRRFWPAGPMIGTAMGS
jgi:hypothetical protein